MNKKISAEMRMSFEQLTAPTVNSNGTPLLLLLRQYLDVYTAAEALLDALAHMAPHGNDYTNSDLLAKALSEHYARVSTVKNIMGSVEHLAERLATSGRDQ